MKQPTKMLSRRYLVLISSVFLLSGCQSMDEFFTETHSTTYETPTGDAHRHHKPIYQRHHTPSPGTNLQPRAETPTIRKAPSSPQTNLELRGTTLQPTSDAPPISKPDVSPAPNIESQPLQKVTPTTTPMVPGAAPTVAP